jgi:hypothetical protein
MPENIPYIRYVVNTPRPEDLPPWVSHTPLYFNENQKQKAKEAAKYNSPLIDLFKTKKYKKPKKSKKTKV